MLTSRNTNYSKPCMNSGDCSPYSFLVFLALSFSLFLALPLSQHTHTPYSAEDLREDSSADLWSSLFVQLSPLCCFTLKALAVLTSLNSELCFFNSATQQASLDSPLPVVWPQNSLGTCFGGPVVKTPYSQCRGTGSIPGEGTEFLHASQYGQKKKNPL